MLEIPTAVAVPLTRLDNGAIRITGTRVGLELVIGAYQEGDSAEMILLRYPTLNLADIHDVLAYYLRNRAEVDAYVREVEAEAERIRAEIESQPGYQERIAALRARMDAYRATRESS